MLSNSFLPEIYVPTFELKVNGITLKPEITKRVLSITVNQRSGSPAHFSFQLYDPELGVINTPDGKFVEGRQVELSLGYVGKEPLTKLIQGKISALTADFPSSGPAILRVDGFDRSYELTRKRSYQSSLGSGPDQALQDSEVATKLAKGSGLKAEVDPTGPRNWPRVQNNISDFAFLEQLAQQNGYQMWVQDDTLYFKRHRPAPNTIRLEWGNTLISFSPRRSTAREVKKVIVRGWNPTEKKPIVGEAPKEDSKANGDTSSTSADAKSKIVVTHAQVSSQKEADTLAKAIFEDLKHSMTTGSGSCAGLPTMQVGSTIEIKGTGQQFDGTYTVADVTHTLNESGYHTSFEVNQASSLSGLQLEFIDQSASTGTERRVSQPIVGIVEDNRDPQKLGRVKVKFPSLTDENVGHWARIATLMAGPQRGTFFLPEISDEVLVVFEEGNIARPCIVGSLWNGEDEPPETNEDGNNDLRLIKTRSGHLIQFDDTKGSEKIAIIDKSGKNQITIDSAADAITIESQKNVSIEAPKGTLKLSGKTVQISSSADIKIRAQGGATLSASGTTSVKGATVNIN